MKILFVSQYFYPETFRGNDIVFDFVKKGHKVTVLTGKPNYPLGTFFHGYKFWGIKKEIIKSFNAKKSFDKYKKTNWIIIAKSSISNK